MNGSDFRQWLAYHSTAFPDWGRMLSRVSHETTEAWRALLIGTKLEHAQQATDEMLSGELRRPYQSEAHITEIAKRAQALSSATFQQKDINQRTFLCIKCNDSGFVSIMHPETVARAQAGEFDRFLAWYHDGKHGRQPPLKGFKSAACWCRCRLAESNREWETNTYKRDPKRSMPRPMRVFDKDQDVEWTCDNAAMIAKAKNIKPRNHEPAFDEWNMEGSEYDSANIPF